jgi:hypothetical protein
MGPTALLPLRRKCVIGICITRKNPPSSVGLEPATESPVGSVASTLTARPPRASFKRTTQVISMICNSWVPKSTNCRCKSVFVPGRQFWTRSRTVFLKSARQEYGITFTCACSWPTRAFIADISLLFQIPTHRSTMMIKLFNQNSTELANGLSCRLRATLTTEPKLGFNNDWTMLRRFSHYIITFLFR